MLGPSEISQVCAPDKWPRGALGVRVRARHGEGARRLHPAVQLDHVHAAESMWLQGANLPDLRRRHRRQKAPNLPHPQPLKQNATLSQVPGKERDRLLNRGLLPQRTLQPRLQTPKTALLPNRRQGSNAALQESEQVLPPNRPQHLKIDHRGNTHKLQD